MKKALLVLSALLIVGAGCSSTATTNVTVDPVAPATVKTAPAATSTTKPAAGTDIKTSVRIVDPSEKTTK